MDQSAPDALRKRLLQSSDDSAVTLHVCVTCRAGEEGDAAVRAPAAGCMTRWPRPSAIRTALPSFRIVEVECLSNCNRGCSAALTGPGRWSYIYGDLSEASRR